MSVATQWLLTPKIFDNQSFLNITIEDKVLLTCFVDDHLIIDYLKGLVFTCATPRSSSKGILWKFLKGSKERGDFRGIDYDQQLQFDESVQLHYFILKTPLL